MTQLSDAQRLTLKNSVLADPVLAALPASSNAINDIIAAYSQPAAPAFTVWRTTTPIEDVFDAVQWKNFTPSDAPDGTAVYTNRALLCQSKQINVQTLLIGQTVVHSAKTNIQSGLKDALQNVPAGTSGANLDAGWTATKAAMTRPANRGERLYATGTGSTAAPGDLVVEGAFAYDDVRIAMGW